MGKIIIWCFAAIALALSVWLAASPKASKFRTFISIEAKEIKEALKSGKNPFEREPEPEEEPLDTAGMSEEDARQAKLERLAKKMEKSEFWKAARGSPANQRYESVVERSLAAAAKAAEEQAEGRAPQNCPAAPCQP